jgi:hypothetical protein
MKLKELKELVDYALLEKGAENFEVVIPNNKPSIGPLSVTKVMWANPLFDWDYGRFIITPENKMIEE